MPRRLLLVPVLMLAATCGDPGTPAGGAASSDRPDQPGRQITATAPATLLADGSVPWADLRITDEDLHGRPPAPRSAAPGSWPCRAAQLSTRPTRWERPGVGGETPRGRDVAAGKLIGQVDVINTSTVECTLQGEAPVTLLADGRQVPMTYAHNINNEARAHVVAVPAGGRATLRVYWSGPFCQQVDAQLELAIQLPHEGGRLHASAATELRPRCVPGADRAATTGTALTSSGFAEPSTPGPSTSVRQRLAVTIAGPTTAAAGSRLTYHVTLRNPTDAAIVLDPCPGYTVELYSPRDATAEAKAAAAVNTHQLYRLNCRPMPRIPAHGRATFEMVTQVPAPMRRGRQLTVTWDLALAERVSAGNRFGILNVTVT